MKPMKPWDDFSRKELIELIEQLTEQSEAEEAQLTGKAGGETRLSPKDIYPEEHQGAKDSPYYVVHVERLEELLAKEKRASEATASAAEGLEVLQLITEEFECRCSALQDQAAICVRCRAQEVIKHLPARAQAMAEVVDIVLNAKVEGSDDGTPTYRSYGLRLSAGEYERLEAAKAKLSALDRKEA